MHGERAMPCCGGPSAAMGARFERSLPASTSGRSLRNARRNPSARKRHSADITSTSQLERHLTALADRAAARLRAHELAAGRVTLKIRRADFKTYTRRRALEPPTQDTAAVTAMAQLLLREWRHAHPDAALRLLGVGVTDLKTPVQADLFCGSRPRDSRLDAAIDGIRERFGSGLLTRASLLPRARASEEPV